jgi:hypothetical protein
LDGGPVVDTSSDSSCTSQTSASTVEGDSIHYSSVETNRLFGGPLSLLYKARRFKPFTDPYVLFESVFRSAALHYRPLSFTRNGFKSGHSPSNDGSILKGRNNVVPTNELNCTDDRIANDPQYESLTSHDQSAKHRLPCVSIQDNVAVILTTSALSPRSRTKVSTSRSVQTVGNKTTTSVIRTATRNFDGPCNNRHVMRTSQTYKDPDTGIVKTCITVLSDYEVENDDIAGNITSPKQDNRSEKLSDDHALKVFQWNPFRSNDGDPLFFSILCC